MTYLPGKFVWFECITNKPAAAQAFYAEVLGWKVQQFPMGSFTYEMIQNGDNPIGGYAALEDKNQPPHWISYLSVDDVDATAKKIVAARGKVLEAPSDIPTVGRQALVADPDGARFRLFRNEKGDQPDASGPGLFCWNELYAPNAEKALPFYEKVFGYTHETMDMGDGKYYTLQKDGVPRGGIFTTPKKEIPPMWLPYVAVADCDATAARAKKHGGTVREAPQDIPNVGRFAIVADPTGATLGVIKLAR